MKVSDLQVGDYCLLYSNQVFRHRNPVAAKCVKIRPAQVSEFHIDTVYEFVLYVKLEAVAATIQGCKQTWQICDEHNNYIDKIEPITREEFLKFKKEAIDGFLASAAKIAEKMKAERD